jgi:hypothetical protein
MVFTVLCQLHDLFERNYRTMADALTDAAATTLKCFQRNNWKLEGAFLSVLHTWGSALNWHPHLHVLVSAGGIDPATRRWRNARKDYSFPVKPLSAVFRALLIARIEALDGDTAMDWPEGWRSVEQRRQRRVELCASNFNIFSKATLGNTRAVVRYLARYTSRIAMSNSRLVTVDEEKREVTFRWKDYRDGARIKERTVSGKHFIRLFTRHLVPKGYRRIRYFGWLAGGVGIAKRPEGLSRFHRRAGDTRGTPGLPVLPSARVALPFLLSPAPDRRQRSAPDRPGGALFPCRPESGAVN